MSIRLEKSKQESKLELIIKCAEAGEIITGNTIYQGKPIGKWLVQYRSQIKKGLNISEEILDQLREYDLLERKIDSNLDEKIQELIEWNKKYPLAKVTNLTNINTILGKYANSENEYQELLKKYKKMQSYYTYIRTRKSQGKLTKKQEKMCREGNIRGVFGYPNATKELSRKYGLKIEKIDYILSKYGNMKNFVITYINNELDDEDKNLLSENLTTFIDISKQGDRRHIKFVRSFASHIKGFSTMVEDSSEIKFFDSSKIPELTSRLNPRSKQIINLRFGLDGEKENQRKEIAEMFKISVQAICLNMQNSFSKLERYEKYNSTLFQGGELSQSIKQQELTAKQKNKMNSILRKIYSSNLIFIPDEGLTQEPNDITIEELASIATQVRSIREEKNQKEDQKEDKKEEIKMKDRVFERKAYTPIENLDFSGRAYNALGRYGIRTLEQLRYKTLEELAEIKFMGTKTLKEIQEKVRAIIPENEEIFVEDTRQETEVPIDELMISDELFNILKRANINTVAELRRLTKKELESIKGIKINGFLKDIRLELERLEKIYGKHITELERLKHLKAEKVDQEMVLRTKTQEASELLDSYEQIVNCRDGNDERFQ